MSEVNGEIQSNIKSLRDLFLDSSNIFFIPEFQRSFVWQQNDIEKMLNDFNEDTNNYSFDKIDDLPGYLLGNIVLINGDQAGFKTVIDGQQRLTTISLVFKALDAIFTAKIADKSDQKEIKDILSVSADLDNGYQIKDSMGGFEQLKIQHDANLSFGNVYKTIIRGTNNNVDSFTSPADQNIKDVYDAIYNYLDEYDLDKLKKFALYFKMKVKLIVTIAPTMAKAFQLFEVLNDRGRSLEPMDLIKNYFLKIIYQGGVGEDGIAEFNSNWKQFGDHLYLGNKKRQISSSTFIRHYLMAFDGVNIKQDELFDYFKEDKNKKYNAPQILKFAESINSTSKIYSAIESGNYDAFSKDRNMNTIFKILNVKQMQPLLMPFYDSSDADKTKLLDSLTRFAASVIFSYTQTNYIESTATLLLKDYNQNKLKDTHSAFNTLIDSIEKYTDDRGSLAASTLKERIFKSKSGDGVQAKLTDLLKFIEYYSNQNNEVINPQPKKRITVEHILSRNIQIDDYKSLGFADAAEKKDYENRLGNLTLIYNTDNSSMGNGTFKDKVQNYKSCSFRMTSSIVEPLSTPVQNGMDTKLFNALNNYEKVYYIDGKENWTKEDIENRSADLANFFKLIVTNKVV